ncbi:hypothetical protein PR048_019758 [Dryococelus australis]|uniref:Uncharacterized protein n=1 Tax=Dryococelus australis TaxID=614101 RepID=A0ABQ9H4D4_9NEOP|nr:hypothetical protein PR048_019758 [Dryococelus australis]
MKLEQNMENEELFNSVTSRLNNLRPMAYSARGKSEPKDVAANQMEGVDDDLPLSVWAPFYEAISRPLANKRNYILEELQEDGYSNVSC